MRPASFHAYWTAYTTWETFRRRNTGTARSRELLFSGNGRDNPVCFCVTVQATMTLLLITSEVKTNSKHGLPSILGTGSCKCCGMLEGVRACSHHVYIWSEASICKFTTNYNSWPFYVKSFSLGCKEFCLTKKRSRLYFDYKLSRDFPLP
jgi:hypothetical protein